MSWFLYKQPDGRPDVSEHELDLSIFPGYVLIKMDLTDEAWHLVNLLQEPVYLLTGTNFPVSAIFPKASSYSSRVFSAHTSALSLRM